MLDPERETLAVRMATESLAVLKSILGTEGGELHYTFLIVHSVLTNELPTFENTKQLNRTSIEVKEAYLKEHFLKLNEVLKVIATYIPVEDKTLLIPYLRQYIKLTKSKISVWGSTNLAASPIIHPGQFGDDKFPLFVIDPFRSRHPIIMNSKSLNSKGFGLPVLPQLILDSHILQYIDWYVNDKSKIGRDGIFNVRSMLQYFASRNYLYSPLFYYFEALSKGSTEVHIRGAFSLYVRLVCLNRQLMTDTGEFSFDDSRFNALKSSLNVSNFEEMVSYFIQFCRDFNKLTQEQSILVELTYCVLIKMIMIQKSNPKMQLKSKVNQLAEFLSNTIKTQLSYEFILAICYFLGHFDRFVRVQKTMKFEVAKRHLLACSWDMLLLRQPELYLLFDNPDFDVISGICTNDKALKDISRFYRLSHAVKFYDVGIFLPTHELDVDYLVGIVGVANYEQIKDTLDLDLRLALFDKNKNIVVSQKDLAELKKQLENEFRQFVS